MLFLPIIYKNTAKAIRSLDKLYFGKPAAKYPEYCLSTKLAQMWLEFLNLIPTVPSQLHSKNYTRIRALVSFIHTNYSQPISSGDIAASAHISQTECVRCFQACLGESPYQYLIKYRLHMSTSLLSFLFSFFYIIFISMLAGTK